MPDLGNFFRLKYAQLLRYKLNAMHQKKQPKSPGANTAALKLLVGSIPDGWEQLMLKIVRILMMSKNEYFFCLKLLAFDIFFCSYNLSTSYHFYEKHIQCQISVWVSIEMFLILEVSRKMVVS